MILVSVPLAKINESLFHQDKSGTSLNLLLTLDKDKNGDFIVVRAVVHKAFDRGKLDSQCGTWIELGMKSVQGAQRTFDLAKSEQPPRWAEEQLEFGF